LYHIASESKLNVDKGYIDKKHKTLARKHFKDLKYLKEYKTMDANVRNMDKPSLELSFNPNEFNDS
jgi:hypothetical protein